MKDSNNEVKYAGFFTRLLVFLVDIFVVSFLVYLIDTVVSIEKNPIIILLIWWLYTAIMLNKWQTTIGGKVLGTRILGSNLVKLSFLKASIRFFVSIAPFMLYTYLRGIQHTMTLPPSPTVQMLPQLIFILLPFVMYLSKKRQMIHDMLVESMVIDVNSKPQKDDTMGERIIPIGQKVLRVLGSVLFLIVFGYVAIYTFVFYSLGKHSSNSYNNSFHTTYETNDFNDSRIIFYKKELETHSKAFIEAEGMYDIFEADTKKDLAHNCIEASLKEHNVTDWIDAGGSFRRNARNKYATTEEKIKKSKENSSYMGRHFYDYDLNDVNEIENSIASIWDSKKNINTCDKLIPIEQMYSQFMVQYFQNREDALTSYQSSYISATSKSTLNKSFYKRHMNQTESWLKALEKNNPDILQKIETYKKKKEEEKQKYIASLPQRMYEKKVKKLWLNAQNGAMNASHTFKDFNATIRNEKGQTPLMIAVQNRYVSVVKMHNVAIVDVWTKDNEGKTAFDYIPISKSKEEKIKNDRLLEALRIVEIRQLIRGKAYITKSVFDTNSTALKIVIGGGKCKDFTFPDNTDCKVKKKRINHPIFTAIKDKDNAQFDRYLKEVNIDMQDPWKQSLLWTALLWRNIYVVDKLLSMGADINELNNMKKRTPLQNAVIDKNIALLKILVNYGIETKSTDIVYIEKMKKLLKESSASSPE
ncbi:MAG TPA: hypothetical protein EYG82_02890 [Sulfurovum sp.]|nr:hypothetical protein [Sulfurovum sp.]